MSSISQLLIPTPDYLLLRQLNNRKLYGRARETTDHVIASAAKQSKDALESDVDFQRKRRTNSEWAIDCRGRAAPSQ